MMRSVSTQQLHLVKPVSGLVGVLSARCFAERHSQPDRPAGSASHCGPGPGSSSSPGNPTVRGQAAGPDWNHLSYALELWALTMEIILWPQPSYLICASV